MNDPRNELLQERRGPALWLTINREERRNAMSHEVLRGLAEAIDSAQHDRSVRAIVVTGAGDRAFCAGADLQSANASRPTIPSHTATSRSCCAAPRRATCRSSRA